jgi:hypothetical protein
MGHMKDLDRRIRQGGDDAIAAVGELLPRWISVEERLPNEGEPVLWHGPADTFCHAVVGKRDGDSIDWGSDLNMDIARSVTHWMPLPEPPEVQ